MEINRNDWHRSMMCTLQDDACASDRLTELLKLCSVWLGFHGNVNLLFSVLKAAIYLIRCWSASCVADLVSVREGQV